LGRRLPDNGTITDGYWEYHWHPHQAAADFESYKGQEEVVDVVLEELEVDRQSLTADQGDQGLLEDLAAGNLAAAPDRFPAA